MSQTQMVSVNTFIERYNRDNRERLIANSMRLDNLDRAAAEKMYERDLKDVVEAAIVKGEVDLDLK